MVLRIQYVVRNAFLSQHPGEHLRRLNRDRADQDGLLLRMRLLDGLDNGIELLSLCLVNRVVVIDTLHRTVGRNHDNVHTVDLTELLLLRQSGTGHAALLVELIEEVLERDGGKRLGFALDLHMLLRLNRLMQSVRITAPRHHAARKFIDNHDLIVADDVIMILLHQIVGAKGQNDAVLNFQILRIRQVFKMEKLLRLLNALCGQIDNLILLINDKISGLLLLDSHDGIDLGEILHVLASGHLLRQNVTGLIDSGGFVALSGNDQRRSCFIDQDGVHLIDDGIVQTAQNQLILVDCHVITQIIKAQLVVGHIGDIAAIGLLSLLGAHAIQNNAYRQSHEGIDLSHPLRVTLRQIVIDSNNVNALAFQCIQINRQRSYQSLTFTGLHLRDSSLMKNDTTDQLNPEGLHIQCSLRTLTDCRKGFRKKIIQSFAFTQALAEFHCFPTELLIRERLHIRPQALNLSDCGLNSAKLTFTVRPENLIGNFCHRF